MSLFADQTETVRVEFGEDWIDLKKHVTYGDKNYAQDRAMAKGMSIELQENGKKEKGAKAPRQVTSHASVGAFNTAYLKRVILAWSDERPVTPEAIEELPESVVNVLLDRINELDEQRTEEEKVPLGGNSRSPSELAAVETK